MSQSLSDGSAEPSRITLTVISFFCESSDMKEDYSMRRFGIGFAENAELTAW